jgi:hypothetical protein
MHSQLKKTNNHPIKANEQLLKIAGKNADCVNDDSLSLISQQHQQYHQELPHKLKPTIIQDYQEPIYTSTAKSNQINFVEDDFKRKVL